MVGARPLLVADGHHRYETALAYQAEQRTEELSSGGTPSGGDHGGGDAGYDAVLALVVELSEEHLQVMAIHRLVSGMPAEFDFLGLLADTFELEPTTADGPALLAEMVRAGALGVATPSGHWLARPRPGGADARYDLDSSRVDAALHRLPPHALVYEHDPVRALAEVRSGAANAAVLCRPATVSQIARTAEGGERMPPKTTFFWPKPRTGMVFRDFSHDLGAVSGGLNAQAAFIFPSSPRLILEAKAPAAEVTPEQGGRPRMNDDDKDAELYQFTPPPPRPGRRPAQAPAPAADQNGGGAGSHTRGGRRRGCRGLRHQCWAGLEHARSQRPLRLVPTHLAGPAGLRRGFFPPGPGGPMAVGPLGMLRYGARRSHPRQLHGQGAERYLRDHRHAVRHGGSGQLQLDNGEKRRRFQPELFRRLLDHRGRRAQRHLVRESG